MKFMLKAALGAGLLALAACGGRGDDTLGDNVAENADAVADNLEDMADNTTNEVVEDRLEDNAAAIREAGEDKEEAIDNADVNAATVNTQ
jgi:ABC-type glycerol-3-phosphate transport system substrate-binding protein